MLLLLLGIIIGVLATATLFALLVLKSTKELIPLVDGLTKIVEEVGQSLSSLGFNLDDKKVAAKAPN